MEFKPIISMLKRLCLAMVLVAILALGRSIDHHTSNEVCQIDGNRYWAYNNYLEFRYQTVDLSRNAYDGEHMAIGGYTTRSERICTECTENLAAVVMLYNSKNLAKPDGLFIVDKQVFDSQEIAIVGVRAIKVRDHPDYPSTTMAFGVFETHSNSELVMFACNSWSWEMQSINLPGLDCPGHNFNQNMMDIATSISLNLMFQDCVTLDTYFVVTSTDTMTYFKLPYNTGSSDMTGFTPKALKLIRS